MNTKWTVVNIQKEALKYKTRSTFRKGACGAVAAARRRGIIDQVCSHMKTPNFWTIDKIEKEALKYNSRRLFKMHSSGAQNAAGRLNILNEVCSHMPKFASGFDPTKPAIVYYLVDILSGLFKIGITNGTVEERFGLHKMKIIKVLKIWKYELGYDARLKESLIKRIFRQYRVNNLNFKDYCGGYTEFFSIDILNTDQGYFMESREDRTQDSLIELIAPKSDMVKLVLEGELKRDIADWNIEVERLIALVLEQGDTQALFELLNVVRTGAHNEGMLEATDAS